jgi:hypothetical protein
MIFKQKVFSRILSFGQIAILFVLFASFFQSNVNVLAAIYQENSASTFNGTYSGMQYNTVSNGLDLTVGSSSGSYTSNIINAGSGATYQGLEFQTTQPILKELPNNKVSETGYTNGNMNMSSNIALYHFNEANGFATATDSSGNGYNLSNGGVAPARTTFSIYNNAVQTNSSGSQHFAGPAAIGSTGRNQWSMSGWFRLDVATGINQAIFFESVGGTNARDRIYIFLDPARKLNFRGTINDTSTTPTFSIVGSTVIPVAGAYYHFAAIFDGLNGNAKMFLNGVQEGGTASFPSGTTMPTTTPVTLPRLAVHNGGGSKLRAKFDEYAMFSTALTTTDVGNLFTRGAFQVVVQMRTCGDNSCSTSSFVGPAGSTSLQNAFSPLNSSTFNPETFTLNPTFFPANEFFQFKVSYQPNQGVVSTGLSPLTKYVKITYTPGSSSVVYRDISFDIRNSADTANTNSCNLGEMTTSATSSCSYRLKVSSSNLDTGYDIYVKTSGNLTAGASSNLPNAILGDIIDSSTLGSAKYGTNVAPGDITSGTISRTAIVNTANTSPYNYTTDTKIITALGNNTPAATTTTNTSLITHLVNISNSTPGGYYTQTVTYTVVPVI